MGVDIIQLAYTHQLDISSRKAFVKRHPDIKVYPNAIDLSWTDKPFRWHQFEHCIWNKGNDIASRKLLTAYRMLSKDICEEAGCNTCLYMPDQGDTELIYDRAQGNVTLEQLLDFIHKKCFLPKPHDKQSRDRVRNSTVLNLAEHMSTPFASWPPHPDIFLDVVTDDFSDLQ